MIKLSEDKDEMVSIIRIPRDRIAVLVGKDGSTKARIQEISSCDIAIDSGEGEVMITGKENVDPIKFNITGEVVKAIGRGFNPEKAMFLYNDGFQLVVLSLRDVAKKGSNRIGQIKARVIGTQGKTRSIIEDITECFISIYGDTISIIGDFISIKYALEAVEKLISGKKQRSVYTYLESHANEMKSEKLSETFR